MTHSQFDIRYRESHTYSINDDTRDIMVPINQIIVILIENIVQTLISSNYLN